MNAPSVREARLWPHIQLALVLAGLAVATTGCSAINDFGQFTFGDAPDSGMRAEDAGSVDGGPIPDGGTSPDGGGPAVGRSTAVVQTAGGDTVLENGAYRLRISVGAPQPVGAVSDGTFRLRLGPQPQ